jgi:hypothetical protein
MDCKAGIGAGVLPDAAADKSDGCDGRLGTRRPLGGDGSPAAYLHSTYLVSSAAAARRAEMGREETVGFHAWWRNATFGDNPDYDAAEHRDHPLVRGRPIPPRAMTSEKLEH